MGSMACSFHPTGSYYFVHWENSSSVTSGAGVLECQETQYVLQTMLMIHPDQASSLQGLCGVSSSILAVNDPGTGTGWQQSKQNWALLAVVGTWSRMECSDHCCGELSPLHLYFVCPFACVVCLRRQSQGNEAGRQGESNDEQVMKLATSR